jgi:hypothetical protein
VSLCIKEASGPDDLVSIVPWLVKRLRRRDHEEEVEVAENVQPHLETACRCFAGTKSHHALYRTSVGQLSVEICGSDDGKTILWRRQNPMDADEPDESPRPQRR